jgi:hypothetical protein
VIPTKNASQKLSDIRAKRKTTEKYVEILLETIEKELQELGYEFGRCSAARLAKYLKETRWKIIFYVPN